MPKIKHDIKIGDKFDMYTVVSFEGYYYCGLKRPQRHRRFGVLCDCGKTKTVLLHALLSKSLKNCGCINKQILGNLTRKHGMRKTRIYEIFNNMKRRCNDKKTIGYQFYGGRGIKCSRNNFEEFISDMYDSYIDHINKYGEKQTTLDRIDNNGNYCKENCKRSTIYEQSINRRSNVLIDGVVMKEYTKQKDINYANFRMYVHRKGIEEAIKYYEK